MSAAGERCLIAHLIDSESLEYLASEGLDAELLPTESLRPVYHFALHYFFEGGRDQAPSEEAIRVEFGDLLDDEEVTLGDPVDKISWAVEDLRGSWLYQYIGTFNKQFADAMSKSTAAERPKLVAEFSQRLAMIVVLLERKDASVDLREGMDERLLDFEHREADRGNIFGVQFGISDIDAYTGGLHPGELAIFAGGPKSGKSLWLAMMALREWEAGKRVVLFTLENSVEMTLDRIACLALGISLKEWSRGETDAVSQQRVRDWTRDVVKTADKALWVLQPEIGHRSIEALVQSAQLHGAQSLFIDQLTFVEFPSDSRRPKTERIGDALHTLKALISTSAERIPCVLAHQVSREGMKMAERVGYLEMWHMADSAEVERSADWVFGLYRSQAERLVGMAKFQTLAARRVDPVSYQLSWMVDTGAVQVRNTFVPGDQPPTQEG